MVRCELVLNKDENAISTICTAEPLLKDTPEIWTPLY